MGAPKKPFYRVVVADSRRKRDGKVIEQLGYYNPCQDPAQIVIDFQKAQEWLQKGAQPTDTVRNLLKKVSSKRTSEPEAPDAGLPNQEET